MPSAVVQTVWAEPRIYLNVEQAQQALFPGVKFVAVEYELPIEAQKQVGKVSGVRWPKVKPQAWRGAKGEWFFVDRVLGKHEDIVYAVALSADGKVVGVEVLEYRESYGDEIRQSNWRAQFNGFKSAGDIKFNENIKNISGATLSCRHVTEGVKRLLSLVELHLKSLKAET